MNKNLINWLIFTALSLIWGSSFILIKLGLQQLSSYQVASLRILSSGLILLPITIKHISHLPLKKVLIIFLSGTLGSLLPAFLFCVAEEKIESALAGTLNALTPVFIIITGVLFFKIPIASNKIIGVLTAFTGCILLLFSKNQLQPNPHFSSLLLVIVATLLYGFNVNMVSKNLLHIPSVQIVAIALSLNAIPSLLALIFTGYFSMTFNKAVLMATGAAVLLGIVGTAIATVVFYILVKRSSVLFASMVTYGIPFVAIAWGIFYGENFGWQQVFCLLIILAGVYYTHKR